MYLLEDLRIWLPICDIVARHHCLEGLQPLLPLGHFPNKCFLRGARGDAVRNLASCEMLREALTPVKDWHLGTKRKSAQR